MNHSLQPTGSQYHPGTGQRLSPLKQRYKRILNAEVFASHRTQRAIAEGMEKDAGQLNRWLGNYEDMPGVHDLESWDREVGHGLLDYLLKQRDEARPIGEPVTVQSMLAIMERQHGASLCDLLQALDDGTITADEAKVVLPGLLRLQSTLRELVDRLEVAK